MCDMGTRRKEGPKSLMNFPAAEMTDGFMSRDNLLPGQIVEKKINVPNGFPVCKNGNPRTAGNLKTFIKQCS